MILMGILAGDPQLDVVWIFLTGVEMTKQERCARGDTSPERVTGHFSFLKSAPP